MRRLPLALLAAALFATPAAHAVTGGVSVPTSGAVTSAPTGGVHAGDPRSIPAAPRPPAHQRRSRRRYPTLTTFSLSSPRLYAYGSPLHVAFRIDGVRGPVPAAVSIYSRGRRVRRIALGSVSTRARHVVVLRGDTSLPAGELVLRISARHLRRGPHASAAHTVDFRGHHFPLAGPFTYPSGGEFGAPRSGHIHQGQDLSAAEGTPIVTPRGGTVTQVAYQARGAGYYVVVRGAGERFSYAFMHLKAGSVAVHVGETILTGQRIGLVGQTGDATGPHLHFEIWSGPWRAGGHPIDPLPYLKRWQ